MSSLPQPKFTMGAEVLAALTYKEPKLLLETKVLTRGTVVGVWYDPQRPGGPHYMYEVSFYCNGSYKPIALSEEHLYE